MSGILSASVLSQKAEMYAMITAIECDFISIFHIRLGLSDLPDEVIARSNAVKTETDTLMSILRGLDLQAYIEIANKNTVKLGITLQQKNFINADLIKIIPVRNSVMHPRPLSLYDYPILKATFDAIDSKLDCFTWESVIMTRDQINNHPETIALPPANLKKNDRIYNNLPQLIDYEETSFIGRKKEIGEIKSKLNRSHTRIISIIGEGGIGKTALALKLLFDLLDDETCKYDMIIWTTLKTNELSNDEFKEIAKSIKTTAAMFDKLGEYIGTSGADDTKLFLIELSKEFNVLLVIDNLETIDSADVREFFEEYSEYGKIIITSRIGIGEFEYRYKLGGLSDDDVFEYTNALLKLYGLDYYSNDRMRFIAQEELHSNPLAIKWFARCLYNGQDEIEILKHKDDNVDFCMSNVYEKLSGESLRILKLLAISSVELTKQEVMYYLDCGIADMVNMSKAMTELEVSSFIDGYKYETETKLKLTEFARNFASRHVTYTGDELTTFKTKERTLMTFGQQMQIRKSQWSTKYSINTIYINEADRHAYYLNAGLRAFHSGSTYEEAAKFVEYSTCIMPRYFENYLVSAYISRNTSPTKARDEYERAILKGESNERIIFASILYCDFLLMHGDTYTAIGRMKEAYIIDPTNLSVKFELVRAYCYAGSYDEADDVLNRIDTEMLNYEEMNVFLSRRAEVIRRRAELFDPRQTQEKYVLYKKAFYYLGYAAKPDKYIFDAMVDILCQLSYLYYDSEALSFILEMLDKNYENIENSPKYKKFRSNINDNKAKIQDVEFKRSVVKYVVNYNDLLYMLKENEGLVYAIKDGFGFCKNNQYPDGVYFSKAGLPSNIGYGDIIEYTEILYTKGKPAAAKPRLVDNIDKRYAEEKS